MNVSLKRTPDDYRGDLDCIDVLDPDVVFVPSGPNVLDVYHNSQFLGQLVSHYGSGGKGKLAAQDFKAAPGVVVNWT